MQEWAIWDQNIGVPGVPTRHASLALADQGSVNTIDIHAFIVSETSCLPANCIFRELSENWAKTSSQRVIDCPRTQARCNMRRGWMTFVLLVATAILTPPGPQAQNSKPVSTSWRTPWSYEGAKGAEHWGDLDPGYAPCKVGE